MARFNLTVYRGRCILLRLFILALLQVSFIAYSLVEHVVSCVIRLLSCLQVIEEWSVHVRTTTGNLYCWIVSRTVMDLYLWSVNPLTLLYSTLLLKLTVNLVVHSLLKIAV